MIDFKFLVPEQIILKRRSLITNIDASTWFDVVSIEEGWGTQGSYKKDYGREFGVCRDAGKVCNPKLVNRRERKFYKR